MEVKQNGCTCISCGHCNIYMYMIICRNVIHELGNRLNGGQCHNKIGGAHLGHVGIAMHA